MIHFIHRNGSAGRRLTIAYRFTDENTIEYGASIFCPDPRRPEVFRKATNRAHAVDRLTRFPITMTVDCDRTRVRNRGQENESIVPVSVAYQVREAVIERGTHSNSRQFQVWQNENPEVADLPDENIEPMTVQGTPQGETIEVAPTPEDVAGHRRGLIRRTLDRISGN